jgi:hypothetical protein
MTATGTLVVAFLTVLVALAAVWASVPRPPTLDGERWFKAVLRAVLSGAQPADVAAAMAPYHPLARVVERKLAHPTIEALPGPALDGEAALLERLAALPDVAARWSHLTALPDATCTPEALFDHDPARWLGPELGWRALEAGRAASVAEAAEGRRKIRWAWIDGEAPGPSVAAALSAFATEVAPLDLTMSPSDAGLQDATYVVADAFNAMLAEDVDARLVIAGVGTGIVSVLRALLADPQLRDRVVAVLSIGGTIGGWEGHAGLLDPAVCEDWLERNFRHEALDAEVVREIPYLAVQWLSPGASPPGADGLYVQRSRFPEPKYQGNEPLMVRVVDLGVLPTDPEPDPAAVVDALRVVTSLYALSRQ